MIAERHFALILEALVIAHKRNHRLHKALKQQKKKSQAGDKPQKRFLQNQNHFHKSPLYPGVSYPLSLSRQETKLRVIKSTIWFYSCLNFDT